MVWPLAIHGAGLKMVSQQGSTAQHTELCSMLCDVLDGRGVKARMDTCIRGFPSRSGTESTRNVGDSRDTDSIPGLGRSPGGGNDHHSFLEKSHG